MKKKQMIAGIVLLILCIGGYFGVKAYNANQEKKQEAETMKPVEVEVSDITGFSYVNNGGILTFEKNGDDWIYSGDTSLDMNEETINGMLEKVCSVTSTEKIQAENLSDYGFDEPTNTITLNTANGSIVVKIGMNNEILSKYYLSIDDSKELYLVESDIVTGFDMNVDNLTVVESSENSETTKDSESTEGSETSEGSEASEEKESGTQETAEE